MDTGTALLTAFFASPLESKTKIFTRPHNGVSDTRFHQTPLLSACFSGAVPYDHPFPPGGAWKGCVLQVENFQPQNSVCLCFCLLPFPNGPGGLLLFCLVTKLGFCLQPASAHLSPWGPPSLSQHPPKVFLYSYYM